MRIARALFGVAVLGVAAPILGCGSSGYQYVQNDKYGVYAKVPGDWAIYDDKDVFPDWSAREREARTSQLWFRTFDGADDPSADHSATAGGPDPTGNVRIIVLDASTRDQISNSGLRGLAFSGDPTQDPMAIAAQDSSIGMMVDEPVSFDGGFHGVHTVFSVAGDDGETTVWDQTALLDKTSSVAFLFQVTCNADCYFETHKDEIANVVDSWTIQEVRK